MIELPDDFRDLLIELADASAEFVVLGGHAVAFHGHPRATKDLDVLVKATTENAAKVYRALAAFGAPLISFEVSAQDFTTDDGVLRKAGSLNALLARVPRVGMMTGWGRGAAARDSQNAESRRHMPQRFCSPHGR